MPNVLLTQPVRVDNLDYLANAVVTFDQATAADLVGAGLGVFDTAVTTPLSAGRPHHDHATRLAKRLLSGRDLIVTGSSSLTASTLTLPASTSPGTVVATLSDPFAGLGLGTTTYQTFGTVPAQLALAGNTVVAGIIPTVQGTSYPLSVEAASGDGKRRSGETITFVAGAPTGVLLDSVVTQEEFVNTTLSTVYNFYANSFGDVPQDRNPGTGFAQVWAGGGYCGTSPDVCQIDNERLLLIGRDPDFGFHNAYDALIPATLSASRIATLKSTRRVAGEIQTKGTVTIDRPTLITFRAKVTRNPGDWPGLWMFQDDTSGNNNTVEIDIMEACMGWNGASTYNFTLHSVYGSYNPSYQLNTGVDLTQDYHEYGVLFDFNAMRIRPWFDGAPFSAAGTNDFGLNTGNGLGRTFKILMALSQLDTNGFYAGAGSISAPGSVSVFPVDSLTVLRLATLDTPQPMLNNLILSGRIVAGVASSGTISGAKTASALVSNVPGLTLSQNSTTKVWSYSYDGSGTAQSLASGIVETLAGATFSPRSSTVNVAARETLAALSLSGSLVVGRASRGKITGSTKNSTITSNVPGLVVNNAALTYTYDGSGSAQTVASGLVETLATATNSGFTTPVTVAAAAASSTPSSALSRDAVTSKTAPSAQIIDLVHTADAQANLLVLALAYTTQAKFTPAPFVSLSSSGTVATAKTKNPHGYANGSYVNVYCADIAGYNGFNLQITVVDASTFTYTLPNGASNLATTTNSSNNSYVGSDLAMASQVFVNDVAMTKIDSAQSTGSVTGTDRTVELWALSNPPTGTLNIRALTPLALGGSNVPCSALVAVSYKNAYVPALQADAKAASSAVAGVATQSATTTSDNARCEVLMFSCARSSTDQTPGTGQTPIASILTSVGPVSLLATAQPGGSGVTSSSSWTTADQAAMVVVPVRSI